MTLAKKASNPMPTATTVPATETAAEFDYRDSLNVARGVRFGLLCATPFWVIVGVVIFVVTR